MTGWLIFGIVVLVLTLWIWIYNYIARAKEKVAEDIEKEYQVREMIKQSSLLLSKNLYHFVSFNSSISAFELEYTDMTIGHCPKCNSGYLQIDKVFTGMDDVYHRYPTYDKFLRCNKCDYTEDYLYLHSRRRATKNQLSKQFIKDFEEAYSIK